MLAVQTLALAERLACSQAPQNVFGQPFAMDGSLFLTGTSSLVAQLDRTYFDFYKLFYLFIYCCLNGLALALRSRAASLSFVCAGWVIVHLLDGRFFIGLLRSFDHFCMSLAFDTWRVVAAYLHKHLSCGCCF